MRLSSKYVQVHKRLALEETDVWSGEQSFAIMENWATVCMS